MSTGKTYSTKYLLDSNNNRGAEGQVLSTTSTGIDWVDANTVPGTGLWLANGNDIYNSNSGNVGIGVTDPEKRLEVKSDTTYDGIMLDVLSAPEITFRDRGNSDTRVGTGRHALDGFHIDTYSGNAVLIKGSNRFVGIGTTNPLYPFSLENSGTGLISRIYNTNADGQGLLIRAGATTSGTRVFQAASSNDTKIMTVNSNGNVGIGESSPAVPLHISRDSASGENIALLLDNNDTTAGSEIGMLFRCMTGGGNTDFEIFGKANAVNDMDLVFESDGSNERVRFTGDGNVGIGATSPSYRLQVGVAGGLADSIRIGSYAVAKDTRQYIGYARHNTGLFESSGDGDTPSTVLAGVAGIRIVNTQGTLASSQADNSVQLLTHIYNGGSRVALHANYDGNVGIGTTRPSEKLAVQTRFTTSASDSYIEINSGHEASGGSDLTGKAGILFKQAGSGNVLRNAGSVVSGREGNYSTTSLADSYLAFSTAINNVNTERMRIDSSGLVEIKNTTPTLRLTNTQDPLGNGTVGVLEFFTNDSSVGATRTVSSIICDNQAGSAVPEGQLVFKTSLGGSGSPVATEKMRIDSSGHTKFTKSTGGIVASFYDGTYGVDLAATATGASIQTVNTKQT